MPDKMPWERDWSAPAPAAAPTPAPSPAAKAPWDHDWQGHAASADAHPADLFASGEVHDGDTFGLRSGGNARLYGVDAFELDQTGRTRDGGTVALGREAQAALLPYAQPEATVTPTGASTYGRPVASLDNGGDAAEAILRQGQGIATPEYLKNDPARLPQYMEAERDARLNRRGAWQTSFQQPSSYRHGTPDPWNPAAQGNSGEQRDAVFWDDPLPTQGLRPEIAKGYLGIWQDAASKPDDLLAYAKANGFSINPDEVRRNYAERNKGRPAGGEVNYTALPRVLTDKGDGALGSAARGFADPFNVLDETGALVDSLVPGSGRENLWNSDRRFGDVYSNNLDQNRSILAADDANHPYARFGGQLASGLVVPGASVEGVGFGAARAALRGGAGRYAAEQAARSAVVRRLGLAGAVEGAAAGVGQGEDWQGRATGGMIGGVAGAALGTLTGYAAPKIAEMVGRPFNKMGAAEGERAAGDFTDGAIDAARARASNDAASLADAGPAAVPGPRQTIDSAALHAASANPDGSSNMAAAGQYLRGEADAALARGDRVTLHVGGKVVPITKPGMMDDGGQAWGAMPLLSPSPGQANRLEIEPVGSLSRVDPRPLEPVSANTQPMDEASGLGLKSVLSFVPRTGKPGVSVIEEDGALATAVYRDEDGVARAAAQIPLTPEAAEIFDGASVYVAPELRRQGIATSLYDALEREGFPIGKQAGGGDLTPDGAGFVSAWRARGGSQAMENETPHPSIDGPVLPNEPAATGRATPLLDPASDDLRRAQAADLTARDVLPVPSNAVASMDEAERIAAGRLAPVRAPNEADELTRRTIPNANTGAPIAKRGPLDLVSWLRAEGGVRAQGGELERYGIDNPGRKGVDFAGGESRLGRLVSNDGMTYDDAAERAWEAGFFPDHAERPTVAEFLDTLADTHSGRQRAFRPDDLAEVDAFDAARRQRHEVEGARAAGAPLVEDRGTPITADDLDRNSPPVEAYEEWGENAPDFAGNIRLSNLDSPQEIRRALVHTEARAGGFDAATRGRITQAETERLAGELGMTPDDLLKRRKGQALNAEEALAARQILARSATDLVNMARRMQRVDDPGEELEAAFKQAWLRHVAIQEQVSGATAEAGRALAAFRIAADSRAVDRVLPSLGDIAGGTARLKDAANMIVDSAVDPAALNSATARALKPRFRDKLIEVYYNSLLSGPTTHAVNILGNTITALGQLPEHAAAATLGAGRRAVTGKDGDSVLYGEVGARAIGLIQGTREGLRQAARTFITGDAADAVTKVEQQTQRAISGVKGSVIRTPTRALAAEDELFKAIARRMELAGMSVREARKEGLTGASAKARAGELLANPSDEMLARSFEYGRYLTFQNPLGDFGRLVSKGTETWPLLKLIVPFVRTPTNILKFAIERSPAAPVLKEWRRDIAAGGAKSDLALAKVMLGSGIGATIFQMASEGKVTGNGPTDPSAKRLLQADGWQPYSFKVGDRYYSYSRLDPYSSIIGIAADLVDLRSHMTDKQQEKSAMLVGAAILHNLANKTWLSGLSTALEAVNDPDRSLENFTSRTLGAIAVPAIAAQTARVVDPILREARDPIARIRSRIPGMSSSLPARRDVFGRAIEMSGGVGPDILSPIATSTSRNDRTVDALLGAGIRIGMPARRDYTPEQYSAYQERAGALMKPQLDALAGSGEWRTMDQDARQDAVDGIVKDARRDARDSMGEAPDALAPWMQGARGSRAPWEQYGASR